MKKETLQKVINIHEGPSWGSWRGPPLTGNFGESEIFLSGDLVHYGSRRILKGCLGRRASQTIRAPFGNLEGSSFTPEFERLKEDGESNPLWQTCERNLEGLLYLNI
jgi:hypothetical protein